MEHATQKTGLIYCRVSSQEQVAGTSLAMQQRYCEEYAGREQIKIIATFVEEGESAKTANRTEFQKALSMCANKKRPIDYFIVHKIDRFARNQDDHTMTQMFLKRYGTKLRSVMEKIDETPVGRMMEGVLSTFAEFDNNVRASRSKSGMVEKVKQGIWTWAAPIGYRRLTQGGNLVIDDDKAPYIQLAFEEWAKGTHSFKSLADFLYERGFRTRSGTQAYAQLMEKMIRNPIYCGTIRAFGLETKGTFVPILSDELFLRCQSGVRSRFSATKREVSNPNFPLRKFAVCRECNKSITGSFSTGRGGVRYPYYHHQKQGCPAAVSCSKEIVEQNFVEFLGRVSPKHKKYEKAFKAVVMDVWQSNYKKLDAENARVRREIEVLEVERQRVFDLHRAGTYSDEEFLDQKDRVNLQVQRKKLLLEEKRIEEFNMEDALNYCFEFVRDSGKTWVKLEKTPVYRARFQKLVFPQKVEFDGNKFGTTEMSLVYELNETAGADSSKLVTQVGRNWNQLITEMIQWEQLGKDTAATREYA